MFNWRQGHAVTTMTEEYVAKAEQCLQLFKIAFDTRLARGDTAEFNELVEKTHMAESTCDDIRRKITEAMYEKALIPESRSDVLRLLEKLDKIPNKADQILFQLSAEQLEIPKPLRETFKQMAHENCECFSHLVRAVRLLFSDPEQIRPLAGQIDKQESACDRLERAAIRTVFADAAIAPDQKILLRDLVTQITRLSDLSENVADLLMLLVVKRLV